MNLHVAQATIASNETGSLIGLHLYPAFMCGTHKHVCVQLTCRTYSLRLYSVNLCGFSTFSISMAMHVTARDVHVMQLTTIMWHS